MLILSFQVQANDQVVPSINNNAVRFMPIPASPTFVLDAKKFGQFSNPKVDKPKMDNSIVCTTFVTPQYEDIYVGVGGAFY